MVSAAISNPRLAPSHSSILLTCAGWKCSILCTRAIPGHPSTRDEFLAFHGYFYYRKTNAWRGALVLMLARGGWVNTVHGNLDFISDDDARWFAKVQSLSLRFEATGRTKTCGGIPGEVKPYGFGSVDSGGAVYTILNPTESIAEIEMPLLSRLREPNEEGRVLFRDAGFVPVLTGNKIKLGPGQLAVVGLARYANPEYDLGIQEDVRIPIRIQPLAAKFIPDGKNAIKAELSAPERGDL